MKGYGEVMVQLHSFLTSVQDGGGWSASRRGRFTSAEGTLGTQLYRGLGGPERKSGRFGKQ